MVSCRSSAAHPVLCAAPRWLGACLVRPQRPHSCCTAAASAQDLRQAPAASGHMRRSQTHLAVALCRNPYRAVWQRRRLTPSTTRNFAAGAAAGRVYVAHALCVAHAHVAPVCTLLGMLCSAQLFNSYVFWGELVARGSTEHLLSATPLRVYLWLLPLQGIWLRQFLSGPCGCRTQLCSVTPQRGSCLRRSRHMLGFLCFELAP